MKKLVVLLLAFTLCLALASCEIINGLQQNDHEHEFGEWQTKTPATCESAEVEVRSCACGEEEVREGDAALGHKYTEQVATEEYFASANCGAKATYFVSCVCGAKGEETFEYGEVLSHNYAVTETVVANCTNGGYTKYECNCGDSYVTDEVDALGHNMVPMSDDTHHWTECDRESCSEATEKVVHVVNKIAVSYFDEYMMENKVLTADDFIVTGICTCGKEFAVTEGIEIISGTLVLGDNVVTVKVGDVSMDVTIYARPFSVAIGGNVKEDTYVYSDKASQEKNYSTQPELSTNGDSFRVLLKYNFSDVINNAYYNDHKGEAKIEFVFTMTTGTIDENTKLTFKAYPVDEVRSDADFSALTWKNYDETYGFGWGKADGFVNKEAGNPRVTISDNTIIITLAYREIEKYVDANGDAFFVLGIWKSGTKIGSVDNENESVRPRWTVHFSNEHIHAFVEEIVDEKYLASANCGETAKYYKSCSCGDASTQTFNHGEVIEHSYGEFVETQAPTCTVDGVNTKTCGKCGDTQTEAIPALNHSYNTIVTDPTCTDAGYTTYTCIRGDHTYTADETPAKGHTSNNAWGSNDSYHWNNCVDCGIQMNSDTHKGGTATETEQAICDTCNQPYGGLASHVHSYGEEVTDPTCTAEGFTTFICACGDVYVGNKVPAAGHKFGEWEVAYPATCEGNEVLVHYCDCGASETGTGAAAFGHDMQTKYDENNHWTECAHNCGKSTDAVAHFGGEATETEQATCEGCGQKYGELKPAEKKEYTINGTIKDDTYIYSSSKTSDLSGKTEMGTYSDQFRVYLRFNFSDILNSADYAEAKADAKVQFSFVVSSGESNITDATKYTFRVFSVDDATKNADFSELTWTNQTATGKYPGLGWGNATNLVSGETVGDKVSYANGVITLTINFSDIENMIDPTTGDALFVFAIPGTKSIKIASMENTTYAAPAVKFVYEK